MTGPAVFLTDGLPGTLRTRAEISATAGRLFTPRHVNMIAETVAAGVPFAADNDGFNGVDIPKWLSMLTKLEPFAAACVFVTVPDVVMDAAGTIALWRTWAPEVRARGFTPALVLQNGMVLSPAGIRHGHDVIAWDEIGAVFVGGDDAFKDGPDAALIVLEARRRGLHVHVGRVNTRKRLEHAQALGANSVDGSGWVRFRNAMMPRLRRFEEAGRPAVAHLAEPVFEEITAREERELELEEVAA